MAASAARFGSDRCKGSPLLSALFKICCEVCGICLKVSFAARLWGDPFLYCCCSARSVCFTVA